MVSLVYPVNPSRYRTDIDPTPAESSRYCSDVAPTLLPQLRYPWPNYHFNYCKVSIIKYSMSFKVTCRCTIMFYHKTMIYSLSIPPCFPPGNFKCLIISTVWKEGNPHQKGITILSFELSAIIYSEITSINIDGDLLELLSPDVNSRCFVC